MYPELFTSISSVVQKINFRALSENDVRQLFSIAQEWETRNAIFMSAHTQQTSYLFVTMLHKWHKLDDEQLLAQIKNFVSLKTLKRGCQDMELALKNDLGIYTVDSPSSISDSENPTAYSEVKSVAERERQSSNL